MELTVRKATSKEKQTCDQVLRSAFRDLVHRLGRELSDASFADLGTSIREGRVMVAAQGSNIVAAATFSDNDTYRSIEHVGVTPQAQGGGIGTKVLEAIERDAREHGLLSLQLDTVEFATDLVRLYTKLGYRVISKEPPKHGRDNHPRVFMNKNLSPLELN